MVEIITDEKYVYQYLDRIGYSGPRTPTLETLRGLHRSHMLSVPFENLSVFQNEEIHLNATWLFDKVVTRRRGGFCLELNSLFAFLLSYLGFRCTIHAARVCNHKTGVLGPELGHLVLIVNLGEEKWLTDVGFGDSFTTPLCLVEDEEQQLDTGTYRIRREGNKYFYEEKIKSVLSNESSNTYFEDLCPDHEHDPNWENYYIFDLIPRTIDDFHAMCIYHQKSPEAPFTHHRLCTVARPGGRITLSKEKLVTTTYLGNNTVRKEKKHLDGEEEVILALEEQFGIKIECTLQNVPYRQ